MDSVSTGRRRGRSLLVGLLLVSLGSLLLLTTTGVASFGIWVALARYWPVLLVLAGVEIIFAQRPLLVRTGVIVLTLGGVVAAAFLSMPKYDPVEPLRASYVEPLEGAGRLSLSMEFMGGNVGLSSDPSGTLSSDSVLAADFRSRPARVFRETSGEVTRVILVSSGPFLRQVSDDGQTRHESRVSFPVGLADWDLTLPPEVEVDLEIAAGAADLELDLRDLNVRRLDIEAGISHIRVQLPNNAGQTHVNIAAGVTNIEIIVPHDVAAKIDITAPIGSVWVDPRRFMHTGDVYQSPHYPGARNRVNIDVEGFAADVTVR